ncbi:hypothetical protein GGE35_000809 [Rhizobium cellulosilyticum]|uniref:Uncharacterized protein n=1 Tax=Aliirhizobium cellulosilyticum TaxID=393664 RepID=A0A7W6WNN3_9HYPH|nr:hypothetical protein [Rhizobium cellulosilyticum]MBB4410340.1 hypothetical protein [Rhizobium cellulosilyticum]MBB4445027.1 hypothetical protein [Rhizobium cellulosilyticum]
MWEAFQGFGAIVAIITGSFIIWERFFRYAPVAFIVSKPRLWISQSNGSSRSR